MKESPILFSAPMVRAILEGRKTQTRRIVKPQPMVHWVVPGEVSCPYGKPGSRLWVRETWQGPLLGTAGDYKAFNAGGQKAIQKPECCVYRATDILNAVDDDGRELGWRPSIHMPRWASRITLEITGVRVERLNDINDRDAIDEGILSVRSQQWDLENFKEWRIEFDEAVAYGKKPPIGPSPKAAFSALWESINGSGSWAANPWVWVVEFKQVTR